MLIQAHHQLEMRLSSASYVPSWHLTPGCQHKHNSRSRKALHHAQLGHAWRSLLLSIGPSLQKPCNPHRTGYAAHSFSVLIISSPPLALSPMNPTQTLSPCKLARWPFLRHEARSVASLSRHTPFLALISLPSSFAPSHLSKLEDT